MTAQDLKNSILQQAIQGKLLPQNSADEPASELLKKISAERQKLIDEGKIKNPPQLPPISDDEKPFAIPESWQWVRFGDLGFYKKGPFGSSLTKNIFVPKDENAIKVYEQKNAIKKNAHIGDYYITKKYFDEKMSCFEILPGDIIVSCAGTIGESFIMPSDMEKGIINQALMRMRILSSINSSYFLLIFDFILKKNAQSKSKGSAIKNIPPFEILKNFIVPLPPLAEQKRIVEKLEEILPLVERYGELEQRLTKLDKEFPDKLKKSLLQQAIQGKLTEQLTTDGDAKDLLEKIRAEKLKLIAEGKIKKEKPLPPIKAEAIPFDIPENWQWVRLGEICEYIQRGKSPKYSTVKKYPVIAQKCNQTTGFYIDKAKFIDPDSIKSYSEERFLQDNDLLWNSTGLGTVGRMAIYNSEKNPYELAVADSHVTVIRPFKNFVANKFIFNYIISPVIQENIETIVSGSTKQKELATQTVKELLIPLPPLAEQKRIVERLEELLPLCDRLK